MILQRAMAVLAFAMFCGFLWILVSKVGRMDLAVVVVVTVALAGYDMLNAAFGIGRRK